MSDQKIRNIVLRALFSIIHLLILLFFEIVPDKNERSQIAIKTAADFADGDLTDAIRETNS